MGADFSLLRALQHPFDRIVNSLPAPAHPRPHPPALRRAPPPPRLSYCDRSTWRNTLRNRSSVSPNRHVLLARLASRLGHMPTCRRLALIQQLNLSTSLLSEMRKYLKRNSFHARPDWVDDWHTVSRPRPRPRSPSSSSSSSSSSSASAPPARQPAKSVSFAQYAELRFFHP